MMKQSASSCLKKRVVWLVAAVALACSFTYLFHGTNGIARDLFMKTSPLGLRSLIHGSDCVDSHVTACKFPNVDIFDPNIVKLAGVGRPTLLCDDFMAEITYVDGLSIKVNISKVNRTLGLSNCHLRHIFRPEFKDNKFTVSAWGQPFNRSIAITEEDEFLHVECFGGGNNTSTVISKAFYSLVPKRKHLQALYNVRIDKRRFEYKPKETLNIVMLALDGLPRHQMIRGMPKTYKHITKNLKSYDFSMYQQVADNTFPNFLALFSGNAQWEIGKWWDFKKPEDAFDLIWHDFERAGYRTLYTEDYPKGAGFYWGGRSFVYPQTSYWNRPLELAMLGEEGFIRKKSACAGSRPISEYQIEYLTRFLGTFPKQPLACAAFIINLTHDDSTKASLIDDHVLDFYQVLEKKGHLTNSLVVFFSDHGERWGQIRKTYNGIVESRNPFLVLTFPQWFLKKYPHIACNLEKNTRRLATHFDTHQMLLDLMYFGSERVTPPFRGRHGMSLFRELPANRTCKDAAIPHSQCLCGQNVETFLDIKTSKAIQMAKALLDALKLKSNQFKDKCEEYSLDKILQVGKLSMPTASEKERESFQAFSVRITVKPGGAMFEGNVHFETSRNRANVGDNIERLNMYKGEVECLPTSRQQMYCYCKGNSKKS